MEYGVRIFHEEFRCIGSQLFFDPFHSRFEMTGPFLRIVRVAADHVDKPRPHKFVYSWGPPATDTAVGVDLEEAAFLKKMIQPLFVPEEVIVSVYMGKDRNESLAEKNVNDFLPQSGNVPDRGS